MEGLGFDFDGSLFPLYFFFPLVMLCSLGWLHCCAGTILWSGQNRSLSES